MSHGIMPLSHGDRREEANGHKSFILWFTGLSGFGTGKSILAHAVEELLFQMGHKTYVFDGDNVRHGLNKDLGYCLYHNRRWISYWDYCLFSFDRMFTPAETYKCLVHSLLRLYF